MIICQALAESVHGKILVSSQGDSGLSDATISICTPCCCNPLLNEMTARATPPVSGFSVCTVCRTLNLDDETLAAIEITALGR